MLSRFLRLVQMPSREYDGKIQKDGIFLPVKGMCCGRNPDRKNGVVVVHL